MGTAFCTGLLGHTFVTSNLARTTRFLTADLGLSLLKRTVHPENERLAVAYFGFPGAASEASVCYIEWAPIFYALPADGLVTAAAASAATERPELGDAKGRWGAGTNHHLALHVADRKGLLRWKRRLTDRGHSVTGPYFRNYFHSIYFHDPDGAILEIATTEPGFRYDEEQLGSGHIGPKEGALVGARPELEVAAETWPAPVEEITAEMRLSGFHHMTSVSADTDRTARFYVDVVGLDLIKRTDYLDAEGTHYYYAAGPEVAPGAILTFFGFPGFPRGRLGTGLAHHITLGARDENALGTWREHLRGAGVAAGLIEDHFYYRSFFFRDPDGHIVAAATPPRFSRDESADALGQRLCLPARFERRRAEIERDLRIHPAPSARPADVAAPGRPA